MSPAHTLEGTVGSAPLLPCTQTGQGGAEGRDGEPRGARSLTPLTELAVEAGWAEALATDGVTGGSLLTLAGLLAASSMEAGGTG